jgi:hypothetical protein
MVIGNESTNWVEVQVLARSHPGCQDNWDGNWVRSEVTLRAGAFSGRYDADLRTDEFARFRDELKAVFQPLIGKAEFSSLEGWLAIEFVGNGKGHFSGSCQAMDTPGTGNRLSFSLAIDQTEIPSILRDLDFILSKFPVIGSLGP